MATLTLHGQWAEELLWHGETGQQALKVGTAHQAVQATGQLGLGGTCHMQQVGGEKVQEVQRLC